MSTLWLRVECVGGPLDGDAFDLDLSAYALGEAVFAALLCLTQADARFDPEVGMYHLHPLACRPGVLISPSLLVQR